MVAAAPEEERTQPVGPQPERAAVTHLLVSTLFLAVAGLLTALSLAALTFPDFLSGILSYGRVRPMALTATVLGWLVPALVGGVYYALPRLTGARLWRDDLATLAGWATVALAAVGVVALGLGLGDGVEPLGLPWWLDLPVLAVLAVPAVVTVQTVRDRTEEGVYVSLWFLLGGVAWLPLLYLFGNLPNLSALARDLGARNFEAGFVTLWVVAVGTGLAYYTVVKDTDNPLASRQLARAGFWSLAFAATWAGPAQLAFGPTPDWLDTVAAVLLLAFPVAAIANAVALGLTIDRGWEELTSRPVLHATVAGLGMTVVVAIGASVAAFLNPAALVGLTSYWDGLGYAALFGVGGLLVAGWVYQAIPPLTGRLLASTSLAHRHVRLTLWGVGGTAALLVAAGIVQGYAWTGASFLGAFEDVAAFWAGTDGIAGVLRGLAVLTGLVALVGQLSFVLVVYRSVTAGRATVQEVLVSRPRQMEEPAEEEAG